MDKKMREYLYACFTKLIDEYGFSRVGEINDRQAYEIEFRSSVFVIRLEKYHREFYPILYKTDDPDNEIDLFNLLSFLNKDFTEFKYERREFHSNDALEEYYEKQCNRISTTLYKHFAVICQFFNSRDYQSKVAEMTKFMLDKYPELFKRS